MTERDWERPRTEEEVRAALQRQVANLRRSLVSYDSGDFEEAERIATSIYTLLHDDPRLGPKKSRSILGQLGLKESVQFTQTCNVDLEKPVKRFEWRNPVPLCVPQRMLQEVVYAPIYGRFGKGKATRTSFAKWWNQPIFENHEGHHLTRKQLIFAARTQDGGSHFDPVLSSKPYFDLSTSAWVHHYRIEPSGFPMIAVEVQREKGKGPNELSGYQKVMNGHWATIRQIAWEIEVTLISHGLADNWQPRLGHAPMHAHPEYQLRNYSVPRPIISFAALREWVPGIPQELRLKIPPGDPSENHSLVLSWLFEIVPNSAPGAPTGYAK